MLDGLRPVAQGIKREFAVYRRALRHPRTPRLAKVILSIATGYVLMPFDLIPDFIPVIGHLDDAVIVPLLVLVALRMIPRDVMEECQGQPDEATGSLSTAVDENRHCL